MGKIKIPELVISLDIVDYQFLFSNYLSFTSLKTSMCARAHFTRFTILFHSFPDKGTPFLILFYSINVLFMILSAVFLMFNNMNVLLFLLINF